MLKPLDNIKVLDLSRVLAGPYATMLMADMGADVIKVERPGTGDDTRNYGPPFINGESTYFMSVNRNKRSMTLNFKNEAGMAVLQRLIAQADVLVENFRPGTMEKLGIGYDECAKINPRLIFASVSGYGHSGPKSKLPGYDLIIQGEGGIASLTGDPDGIPYKAGTSQADIIAGMNAFQGVLLALLARGRTERGQKVDIGMLDCQVSLLTYQAARYFATGESPTRMGNRHPSIVPYESMATKDGFINIACGNERMWQRFCQAADLAYLIEDDRFRTNSDRVAHRAELEVILGQALRAHTSDEWLNTLRAAGVPSGRIESVGDVCDNPQVLAREMVIPLEHPKAGTIRVTGIPMKLSDTPGAVLTAPPLLGQHTAEILDDWLEIDERELSELMTNGAF